GCPRRRGCAWRVSTPEFAAWSDSAREDSKQHATPRLSGVRMREANEVSGAAKKRTREGVIGETPCPGRKFYRCPDCRNRRYPRGGAHRSWPDQPRHREIKNPLKRRKAAVIFLPAPGAGAGAEDGRP